VVGDKRGKEMMLVSRPNISEYNGAGWGILPHIFFEPIEPLKKKGHWK